MRVSWIAAALAVVVAAAVPALAGNLVITPTTTLQAETANNTSTAEAFPGSSNGNLPPGNVSKQPIRDLLFPGFAGKVYANWVPWFGGTNHVNVGYNSADRAQIRRQIEDMMSRGIDGVAVDWWNAGNIEIATTNLMYEAETYPGFEFALMYDAAQLKGLADPTARVINDLNYADRHYYGSPAYMKTGGRPVVLEFGTELYGVDWARVLASVSGNPIILFRNSGGYYKTGSSGAFGWGASSQPTSYLDYFYQKSLEAPAHLMTWGAATKGFDDSLAAWGQNRYVSQQCGQTWLLEMAAAGRFYAANPSRLTAFQVVTWNDYEEGTALETGIDNCVTVSASLSGTTLSWAITGKENTIDHYTVFVSLDGESLMPVAELPAGTRSLDLATFALGPASYTVYVKAVGQASMRNQMSGPVIYVLSNLPPVAQVSADPPTGIAPLAVTATTTGSSDPDGQVASSSIDFGDGTVLSGPVATHTYASAGTYTIVATVTDDLGGNSTASTTVGVAANQAPLAALAVSPARGVAPLTVTASTSSSTDADGNVVASTIDFGDGTSKPGPVATHTYAAAGNYTVTASVTDERGGSANASASVTVDPAGVLVSAPQNGATVSSPVRVVASAVSGNPITALWIYLDYVAVYKTSASSLDTSLTVGPGTHSLVVQAWDSTGKALKTPLTITVGNQPPVAHVEVSPAAGTAPVTVTASTTGSSDADGSIASSTIDFGDGTVVAGTSASHAYRAAGTYTVRATVTDNLGATAQASTTVVASAPKVVITTPPNGATVSTVTQLKAYAVSGAPITGMWVYVDGVAVYKTPAASVSTYLKLRRGTRNIVVNAWDATGALFKSGITVIVR